MGEEGGGKGESGVRGRSDVGGGGCGGGETESTGGNVCLGKREQGP